MQIWTECIFRTPPSWGVRVRPINLPTNRFLETDWLQYDV